MKLISCKSAGIQDACWNALDMTVEIDGKQYTGKVLFEIDGRDAELEGFTPEIIEAWDWNAFWEMGEEATKLIETEMMKVEDFS